MGVSKVLRETMLKGVKPKLRNIPSTSTEDGYLKMAFWKFHVPLCGKFSLNECGALDIVRICKIGTFYRSRNFMLLFCTHKKTFDVHFLWFFEK